MRLFHLDHYLQAARAAEGCLFGDGQVVLQWLTPYRTWSIFLSIEVLEGLYTLSGDYQLFWDEPPMVQIKLEDLGSDQEKLVEALCAKIGVPYEPKRSVTTQLPFLGMPGGAYVAG